MREGFEWTTLYLDLDGVLADFDRGVEALIGATPEQLEPNQMWPQLARHGDFFANLEMTEDGPLLWEACAPLSPVILTGLPRGRWAEPQKRRWVAEHLGEDVEVITCMSRDKPQWSGPGRVLVDDRDRPRQAWESAGGVFIHHTSAAQTLAELEALGLALGP